MLQISKRDSRRLEYKGREVVLFSSGLNVAPRGPLFDKLCSIGVNLFTFPITPTFRKDRNGTPLITGPYKYVPGRTIKDNWGGWNDKFWAQLRGLAKDLKEKKKFLVLPIFSTCMRKSVRGEGRFQNHLFNTENGGIFAGSAVNDFYDLKDETNIDAQKKLIKKVIDVVGGLPNVIIILQWEIFTGFKSAIPWAVEFLEYLREEGFKGPIGIGTHHPDQLKLISDKVGFPICGLMEANNIKIDMEEGVYDPPKSPIIPLGFHPRKEGYYSRGKKERKCLILKPDEEKNNVIASAKTMIFSLEKIFGCSLPFEQYIYKVGSRTLSDCKQYGIENYNLGFVRAELFKFLEKLSSRYGKTPNLEELIPTYESQEEETIIEPSPHPITPEPEESPEPEPVSPELDESPGTNPTPQITKHAKVNLKVLSILLVLIVIILVAIL